jgi:hypothetical protein
MHLLSFENNGVKYGTGSIFYFNFNIKIWLCKEGQCSSPKRDFTDIGEIWYIDEKLQE